MDSKRKKSNYSRLTIHESSDSMHCIEQIFALSVDAHSEFFTFTAKAVFQLRSRQARARGVGDNYHGELSLHDCLIDIDDAATCLSQNLRYSGDDARVIYAENRDDQPFSRTFAGPSDYRG